MSRSAAFFTADIAECVDYVLDQASMYDDQSTFIKAVAKALNKDAETAQTEASKDNTE